MKSKLLTETAYPPPPPPPPSTPAKGSRKLLVVAFLIIIIVVSAVVLVYLATAPSSTNPTPTPSATPTGSPTGSPTSSPAGTSSPSATSSPSGNQAGNFRVGWAEYAIKTYDESGALASQGTMKYSITEGTYSGAAVWLLNVEMTNNVEGGTMKNIMTYWVNKNTMQGVHVKTQVYMNGELISENEEDIAPGEDSGTMPDPIDLSTTTSTETITVPAGTFTCGKITVTTPTGTSSSWASASVPVIGLVKIETTYGGKVQSTTELIGYG